MGLRDELRWFGPSAGLAIFFVMDSWQNFAWQPVGVLLLFASIRAFNAMCNDEDIGLLRRRLLSLRTVVAMTIVDICISLAYRVEVNSLSGGLFLDGMASVFLLISCLGFLLSQILGFFIIAKCSS